MITEHQILLYAPATNGGRAYIFAREEVNAVTMILNNNYLNNAIKKPLYGGILNIQI